MTHSPETEQDEGTPTEFDPTGPTERRIAHDFYEEESTPGAAMAHLYRGEIHRMNFWRERLDRTTYWAITVMAGILTWAFTRAQNPHHLLLFTVVLLTIFLVIEARRYRGYDMWRSRVRILQKNVFAYALDPSQGLEDPDWRVRLSQDYRNPKVKISYEEAVAHRLRRVYFPLFLVLLGAWILRTVALTSQPWPASASIGSIPGVAVTTIVVGYYVLLAAIAYRPRTWKSHGELRDRDIGAWDDIE